MKQYNNTTDRPADIMAKYEKLAATDRAAMTRDELRDAADQLYDLCAELTAAGRTADAFTVQCLLDFYRYDYMRRPAEAAEVAAPAADSLAAKVADVARVWLLCCCLAAAPAAADSIDTPADVCELLTADPLAQVAEFAAAGLTVSHVTIKSLPAREIPAADVPALLTC